MACAPRRSATPCTGCSSASTCRRPSPRRRGARRRCSHAWYPTVDRRSSSERIATLVEAYCASELAAACGRARPGMRPEVGFAFEHDGVLLNGRLDAHWSDGTRALVLDYKTNVLGESTPEEVVAEGYTLQRLVYALACLRTGVDEVEVVYHFLERPESPVEATFTRADVPALEAELSAAIARVRAGEFRPTPSEFACADCPALDLVCAGPRLALRVSVRARRARGCSVVLTRGRRCESRLSTTSTAICRRSRRCWPMCDREGIETIVAGGDVLWGPFQAECLDALRAAGALFVSGNCERDVLGLDGRQLSLVPRTARAGRPRGRRRLAEHRRAGRRRAGSHPLLPRDAAHRTRRSSPSRTPDEDVAAALAGVVADVVVCGHTHVQQDRQCPASQAGERRQRGAAVSGPRRRVLGGARPRPSSSVAPSTTSRRRSRRSARRAFLLSRRSSPSRSVASVSAESATEHFEAKRRGA